MIRVDVVAGLKWMKCGVGLMVCCLVNAMERREVVGVLLVIKRRPRRELLKRKAVCFGAAATQLGLLVCVV